MGEAADALVMSGMHTGQVACRVMYRLAHHADTLYAGIQAQRQSAEWHTAQAVIKQKRQQVSPCWTLATHCHRQSNGHDELAWCQLNEAVMKLS